MNMQPVQLGRESTGQVFADGSNSTPLRGGVVRLPRPRLLDRHFKLEIFPTYTSENERTIPVRSFVQRNENGGIIPGSQYSVADRFIPRRKGQNFEAAYCYLAHSKPPKKSCELATLDLPNDLNRMDLAWQKRSMARALQTIIPGTGYHQVLQLSIPKTDIGTQTERPGNSEEPDDSPDEYKWPVKPRRHPVIGAPEIILDIPHFRPSLIRNLMDWSSQNIMAAVINHGTRHTVRVMDSNVDRNTDDMQFVFDEMCTAVKFSNSGEKIAIGKEPSFTSVYVIRSAKAVYRFYCNVSNHASPCHPQAFAWSKDDRYIIAGCSGGFLAVSEVANQTGTKILAASWSEIVAVSFSPNEGYIGCCGKESTVRIFTWPDLTPFLEIAYFGPIRAMAWHPWESSVLCVGGGPGDGSISLWNVQRQMFLTHRTISFTGSVDTIGWNKVTGELMVNWYVRDRGETYAAMPIYANFNRVTDAIVPAQRKSRIPYTFWSQDGSQIACQTNQSVFIYNVLDKRSKERIEKQKMKRCDTNRSALSFNIR